MSFFLSLRGGLVRSHKYILLHPSSFFLLTLITQNHSIPPQYPPHSCKQIKPSQIIILQLHPQECSSLWPPLLPVTPYASASVPWVLLRIIVERLWFSINANSATTTHVIKIAPKIPRMVMISAFATGLITTTIAIFLSSEPDYD